MHLFTEQVGVSRPYFAPTDITQGKRNQPAALVAGQPAKAQQVGRAMSQKAVGGGKVPARQAAQMGFDAA